MSAAMIAGPAFTGLCRRNRGRILAHLMRLRHSLDPSNLFDAELGDALDVEIDRLSRLIKMPGRMMPFGIPFGGGGPRGGHERHAATHPPPDRVPKRRG